MTVDRIAATLVFAAGVGLHAQTLHSQMASDTLATWARAHARPIQSLEPGSRTSDLEPLRAIIGDARVVSMGEPVHGAREPLAFRNRLFRFLVEEMGFTAIALESGFPESRHVSDFVSGASGTASQAVRKGLTWGFGEYAENADLVQWMRDYNADPAHRRKIRLYGIDLSLGGPGGARPTPTAIGEALAYLARVDPAAAKHAHAALAPFTGRLPGGPADTFSSAEHDAFTAAIDDLIAVLERERPAYVPASSVAEYDRALRNAIVARQADRVFRVEPPQMPGGGIPPAAWRGVNARDAAMAENVGWVLEQEGREGRVLVFAHNAHVKNAPTAGGVWAAFERPPNSMGQYLQALTDDQLVVIGTSAAQATTATPAAPGAESLEAAMARVGLSRFLLDLRPAAADAPVATWLATPRPMAANFGTFLTLSPGAAFDVLIYLDALTPAHTLPPHE